MQHDHVAAHGLAGRALARLRGYGAVVRGGLRYSATLPGRRWDENWTGAGAPGPLLVREAAFGVIVMLLLLVLSGHGARGSMSVLPHRLSLLFPLALATGVVLTLAKMRGTGQRMAAGRAAMDVAVIATILLLACRLTVFQGRGLARLVALAALPTMCVSLTLVGLRMVGRVRRWFLPVALLVLFVLGRSIVPPLWNAFGKGDSNGIAAAAVTWCVHLLPWLAFLLLPRIPPHPGATESAIADGEQQT